MKGTELKCNYAVAHTRVQLALILLRGECKDDYLCFKFVVQFERRQDDISSEIFKALSSKQKIETIEFQKRPKWSI